MTDSRFSALWKKIETLRVAPLPRSLFLAKKWAVYVLLVFSVVLGALSLAYGVYGAQQADMFVVVQEDPLVVFSGLGLLWLLVFGVFVAAALWSCEQTERGYRVPLLLWTLGNLTATGLLALLFLAVGLPGTLDPLVERHLPAMGSAELARGVWDREERGRVRGIIRALDPDLQVEDPHGRLWTVQITPDTRISAPLDLQRPVGIQGDILPDFHIRAGVILPPRRLFDPRGEGNPGMPHPAPRR